MITGKERRPKTEIYSKKLQIQQEHKAVEKTLKDKDGCKTT